MKENKNRLGSLNSIVIIGEVVLLIIIGVMGFVIYYQRKEINENASTSPKEEVKSVLINDKNVVEDDENIVQNKPNVNTNELIVTDKNEVNQSQEQTTSKNVQNKPYIYDAQYSTDRVDSKSYQSSDGNTYSVSDIKVPYINLKSEAGDEMNSEIEALYKGYIEEFKTCSQNKNSFIKVSYQTFITSNINSVLITVNRSDSNDEFVSYNFDTISGTKLDYNQVCNVAGIQNSAESVRKSLANLEDYANYKLVEDRNVSEQMVKDRDQELESLETATYTNYQEELMNKKLVYFLDSNLKLNIAVNLKLPENKEVVKTIIIDA